MQLSLPEELFLLTLDEDKGAIVESMGHLHRLGVSSAILAELTLSGNLCVDDKRRLIQITTQYCGNPGLDLAMAAIQEMPRLHKVSYWILVLSKKPFRQGIADSLIGKGLITQEEKRFQWVIPVTAASPQETSAKYWIKKRLREAVLINQKPDPRTILLLSLAKACQLFPLIFTKDERNIAKRRMSELVKGEIFGESVDAALKEIEAAALAVVMTSTT